jgi:hypothetical protein
MGGLWHCFNHITMVWMFFFNGVYYYQISWIFGGKTNVTTVFQKKTGELGELFLV